MPEDARPARPELTSMNISLPCSLAAYVDEQGREGDYASVSEFIRELIRRDRDRRQGLIAAANEALRLIGSDFAKFDNGVVAESGANEGEAIAGKIYGALDEALRKVTT